MRSNPTVAIILIALTCVAAHSDSASKDRETVLDLRLVEALLISHNAEDPTFEYPDEWTAVKLFAKDLTSDYRKRTPTKDAWGKDLLLCTMEETIIVVSTGPNGSVESFESTEGPCPSLTELDTADDAQGDDLILIVGQDILNAPRNECDRLKRAMADMRSAAVSVEEYSIDHNVYPAQELKYEPLSAISRFVEPVYIRSLPRVDSWGNEYIYWSDGKGYVIISPGDDGVFDHVYGADYSTIDFMGPYIDPATDMVFVNGTFAQWPEGRCP